FAGELCQRDTDQWFFFVPRQEREAHGGRPNRLTTTGYWKATGSLGYVYSNNGIIGVKRTMVFCRGRVPGGRKTEWKMNECRAIEAEASSSSNATPPKQLTEIKIIPPNHNASSGDRTIVNNPCQVMENGSWDWDVSVDNDFLWDWDELNWF
ncbi:unnamed protein product, partial [Ilex paraguariensis]